VNQAGLKNCPFCGQEVELVPEGDYHEILCKNCWCSMQRQTYEELYRIWNIRHEEAIR